MKIVEVRKDVLVVEYEDYVKLNSMRVEFEKLCAGRSCSTCPFRTWCDENDSPAEYLKDLIEFIKDHQENEEN